LCCGRLNVLQWAFANNCPWDWDICRIAAYNGRLDILKWARKVGCPWDVCTCAVAAERGHNEILKWARKHGCPWDANEIIHHLKRWKQYKRKRYKKMLAWVQVH
jgi:hypothetical protein